jgi:hypothetical protein
MRKSLDTQNDVYFEKYLISSLIKPNTETGRLTESESPLQSENAAPHQYESPQFSWNARIS